MPVAPRGALTPPRGRSYAKVCDVYASSKERSVLKVRPSGEALRRSDWWLWGRLGPPHALRPAAGAGDDRGLPAHLRRAAGGARVREGADDAGQLRRKGAPPRLRARGLLFAQEQRDPAAQWARPPHGTQQAAPRRPGVRRGGAWALKAAVLSDTRPWAHAPRWTPLPPTPRSCWRRRRATRACRRRWSSRHAPPSARDATPPRLGKQPRCPS